MNTLITSTAFLILALMISPYRSISQGVDINEKRFYSSDSTLKYVKLNKNLQIVNNGIDWLNNILETNDPYSWKLVSKESDKYGFTHYRLRQTYLNRDIEGSMYLIHVKNNRIISANGEYTKQEEFQTQANISEEEALGNALDAVNAEKYLWEKSIEAQEHTKMEEDSMAASLPSGELLYYNNEENKYVLCYRFDIYSYEPFGRQYVFINATNGAVEGIHSRIWHLDVNGSGITKYSGTVSIICDSTNSGFRLREISRGNGIETYNMKNSMDFSMAVDFYHPDKTWDSLPTGDTVAIDAHFGAEGTFDYLLNVHNRSSIDDNGYKLLNYVHFGTRFGNAFWDGSRMVYGDGNGNIMPFVSPDICAHEIGHGLQQYTAGFNQSGESGALAESFSDILGLLVEAYLFPSRSDKEIYNTGDQINGDPNGIRNYIDPSLTNHPSTYRGNDWDFTDNNLHGNGVVQNHWFYILAEGLAGVNDNSDTFNVQGIGRLQAAEITYRALTVYLTPNSNFQDARFYSIQAAKDIFGSCSNEVKQTTNAWYAVGVGDTYNAGFSLDFDYKIDVCENPISVTFRNLSTGATQFIWEFGDGSRSTAIQPIHSYSVNGTYTVKVSAFSCDYSKKDSVVLKDEIFIDNDINCDSTVMPKNSTDSISGCYGWIYDSGGRNMDALNNTGEITVRANPDEIFSLKFTSFDYTFYGDVTIFNGKPKGNDVVFRFSNSNRPKLDSIYQIKGSTFTVKEEVQSNLPGFPIGSGFELFYRCHKDFTGISGVSSKRLQIYPNPTTRMSTIHWEDEIQKVEIYDYSGRLVNLDFVENYMDKVKIDLVGFPPGMYYLKIYGSENSVSGRIMVVSSK